MLFELAHRKMQQRTVRLYPTNGRLGLYLDREGISPSRLALVCFVLNLPCSEITREFLLKELRREPCHIPTTVYGLADYRLGRVPSMDQGLLIAGLSLLGRTYDEFFDRQVSYVDLTFTCFASQVCSDLTLLDDIRRALSLPFSRPVNAYAISQWINGHRNLCPSTAKLLETALKILRPDCPVQLEGCDQPRSALLALALQA